MLLLLIRENQFSSFAGSSILLKSFFRFALSVFAYVFCSRKNIYIKKAVSPDHQNPQPSIYIDKYTVYTYTVYMYTAL